MDRVMAWLDLSASGRRLRAAQEELAEADRALDYEIDRATEQTRISRRIERETQSAVRGARGA